MKIFKFKLGAFALFFILVINASTINGLITTEPSSERLNGSVDHDFYFIHLTDTHVISKVFDHDEVAKKKLQFVLAHVCSFERKPAFIVITGDLTHWGGGRITGALNCLAFASCFYKKDGQFYADSNLSIPVYTTPGNHEYIYTLNLRNYHRYIKTDDRYIVNYDNVSLFFMDSGHGTLEGGAGLYDCDMDWLEGALENCSSQFKVILMHHPAMNIRNEKGRMLDVITRNREAFTTVCENHQVDLVLAGHTHQSRVFDSDEKIYTNYTILNSSLYSTLYVQTDDLDHDVCYRNISIIGNDLWVENSIELTFP